jgi:hypothetical protein
VIDSSFFQYLDTLLNSGSGPQWGIQEGKVDFTKSIPWVWFRRSSTIQERLLDGTPLDNFTSQFDVEIVSDDIDEMQATADYIKAELQTIVYIVMGETKVFSVSVEDHQDDYVSRTVLDTDEGLHIAALFITFLHRG